MAYDRKIKVKQSTVDSMKQLGMAKALEKANSGSADGEFVEAAKRFYGNRVKPVVKSSPTVTKTAAKPTPHVTEVRGEYPKKVSNKYVGSKRSMA